MCETCLDVDDGEEERVILWVGERMLEACAGDEETCRILLAAGADYHAVARARARGASLSDLARCFG